jgi:formate C-acetyltransferase
VEADVFTRTGHKHFLELWHAFYNKPVNNLITFEWEHAAANFDYIVKDGIDGVIARIEASKKQNRSKEELAFLEAIQTVCGGIIGWANKCSKAVAEKAKNATDLQGRKQLEELSQTLLRIPQKPSESFYEAVLCVYFCFSFLPDSIGTIDRYLYPYFRKDIDSGKITRDEAKEFLQELFLRLQAHTSKQSDRFTRGGESHFSVGGYTPTGEDGFNELSQLIVEAMIELPTWIPQISLRWTKKTPYEVFRFVMDCERKDKNKRVTIVNDDPRIKALTEIVGLSFADAVNYTMVGCNEIVLQGGVWMSGINANIVRSLTNTLYNCSDEISKCRDFEAFYSLYERELHQDLAEMLSYVDKFNDARSRDASILSSVFLQGCIENAKSVTNGGSDISISGLIINGTITAIDSLSIIKQFVYDEKRVTMQQLLTALQNNWEGHEELHTMILKTGRFFGNNDPLSDEMARRFTTSIYSYLKGKTDLFGYKYLVGELIGYNLHNQFFGEKTGATPDGRYSGDIISFGISQSEGKDREGLTALLTSIAQADPNGILCGPSVINIMIDEKLVRDDVNFEKTVKMFETYLKLGGLHFQLNYVSKEDLKQAKITPERYKSLRVRVSGFSDYFVSLEEGFQDEVIKRTTVGGALQ